MPRYFKRSSGSVYSVFENWLTINAVPSLHVAVFQFLKLDLHFIMEKNTSCISNFLECYISQKGIKPICFFSIISLNFGSYNYYSKYWHISSILHWCMVKTLFSFVRCNNHLLLFLFISRLVIVNDNSSILNTFFTEFLKLMVHVFVC